MICVLALLVIALLFAIYFIYKLLHRVEKTDAVRHVGLKVKKGSLYSAVIDQILCKISIELGGAKVILARFHNGGYFSNGLAMEKFTVTNETPGGSKEPLMDKCVAVLNSKYASSMLQLATCDYLCIADINDCEDKAFKRDMEFYGFKSTNLFLIRQLGDGTDEGFIGVNFRDTHVMNAEERNRVTEKIPRLLNLVNQQESSLRD